MRADLPTGTVTFLFTDVEGSTRLLHELGAEAYAQALLEHRRVIRDACAAEGGVEVDTQGDAFFFAFSTAPGALAAAQELTKALSSAPIRVRVGLHSGTPLLTEEGYVGDDVHLAARIASSAHGGQVALSAATAHLVGDNLRDLGEHRLKDIERPVSIFQLGRSAFPPLKTISNTNLPRPVSRFLGRERELSEAMAMIEQGARLLTFTGPGGTGKTRLAIETAGALLPEYPGGVYWVGLASVREASLVRETIAQALGAKDGVAEHIGGREVLLLLDNLEQVVAAAPELAVLLEQCPRLTLLVTSRELLRVQGEVEYQVPPLAAQEAIELFCARTRLAPSDAIAELCARLDSLPLAVELAAARTSALTPEQILERISGRLDLLKGGRDADPRQQTLRATIGWSYDLLSHEEQGLFCRLSVFAGGCTLEAAEAVADAQLDALQSLVEKSLLRFTNGRYWMLETIREYAWERLHESPHHGRLEGRHARWFVELLALAAPELEGPVQSVWLDQLQADYANIRAALRWALDERRGDLALRLAGSCGAFWWVRGYWTEGRRWLEEALSALGAGDVAARSKALESAANLAFRQHDYAEARRLAEETLVASREVGDASRMARALRVLALVTAGEGDNDGFRELVEQSAAFARQAGDSWALVMALNNMGYLALDRGDPEGAMVHLEEALALARSQGDERGEAFVLGNLGLAKLLSGIDSAGDDFATGLRLAHRLRFFEVATGNLLGLAVLAAKVGRFREASRLIGGAERMLEEIGTDWDTVECAVYADLAADFDRELGRENLEQALREGRSLGFDDLVEFALADA